MSSSDPLISTFHEWMEIFMHHSMRGYMHYARDKGLSRSMIGTLHLLSHREHAGVTDIGEHLGVSSAAASQMLEHLVEAGLIERTEDPDDRRMKKISLTEKGYQVMKDSVSTRLGWLEQLTDTFSEEEKVQFTVMMDVMIKKAKEIDLPEKGDCNRRSS